MRRGGLREPCGQPAVAPGGKNYISPAGFARLKAELKQLGMDLVTMSHQVETAIANAGTALAGGAVDVVDGFSIVDSEARGQTTAKDLWGIQPRPQYKRIGYRDLVKFRDERLAKRGQDRELAKSGRMDGRRPRQKQRGRKDCDGDRSTHDFPRATYS